MEAQLLSVKANLAAIDGLLQILPGVSFPEGDPDTPPPTPDPEPDPDPDPDPVLGDEDAPGDPPVAAGGAYEPHFIGWNADNVLRVSAGLPIFTDSTKATFVIDLKAPAPASRGTDNNRLFAGNPDQADLRLDGASKNTLSLVMKNGATTLLNVNLATVASLTTRSRLVISIDMAQAVQADRIKWSQSGALQAVSNINTATLNAILQLAATVENKIGATGWASTATLLGGYELGDYAVWAGKAYLHGDKPAGVVDPFWDAVANAYEDLGDTGAAITGIDAPDLLHRRLTADADGTGWQGNRGSGGGTFALAGTALTLAAASPGAGASAPAGTIMYSTSADRSSAVALAGASGLVGSLYVHYSPDAAASPWRVRWYLDGALQRTEYLTPYDFLGDASDGADPAADALAWATDGLEDGSYTIRAEVLMDDGTTDDQSATFTLANNPTPPTGGPIWPPAHMIDGASRHVRHLSFHWPIDNAAEYAANTPTIATGTINYWNNLITLAGSGVGKIDAIGLRIAWSLIETGLDANGDPIYDWTLVDALVAHANSIGKKAAVDLLSHVFGNAEKQAWQTSGPPAHYASDQSMGGPAFPYHVLPNAKSTWNGSLPYPPESALFVADTAAWRPILFGPLGAQLKKLVLAFETRYGSNPDFCLLIAGESVLQASSHWLASGANPPTPAYSADLMEDYLVDLAVSWSQRNSGIAFGSQWNFMNFSVEGSTSWQLPHLDSIRGLPGCVFGPVDTYINDGDQTGRNILMKRGVPMMTGWQNPTNTQPYSAAQVYDWQRDTNKQQLIWHSHVTSGVAWANLLGGLSTGQELPEFDG